MKIGPWLESSKSPGGGKSDRLIGIRIQVTWLEIKAAWRRLMRRKEPTIELPTSDDFSEEKPTEPHIRK